MATTVTHQQQLASTKYVVQMQSQCSILIRNPGNRVPAATDSATDAQTFGVHDRFANIQLQL